MENDTEVTLVEANEKEPKKKSFFGKMKQDWKESSTGDKLKTIGTGVGLGVTIVCGALKIGTGVNDFKASKAKVGLFHDFEKLASDKGIEELLKKK